MLHRSTLAKTWPKHILWHNGGQNWNLWCLVGHEKVFHNTKHYFGQDRSVRSHKWWNQEKSMNSWNLRMILDLNNAWFFHVFWPNLGQDASWWSTSVSEMSQMVFGHPLISLECVKMYSGQDLAKKHPISTLVIVFTDMHINVFSRQIYCFFFLQIYDKKFQKIRENSIKVWLYLLFATIPFMLYW